MAASNNLQDLCYLSHSGGGGLAGPKPLKPILFFLLRFAPCLAFSVMFVPDPCVLLATWGTFVHLENSQRTLSPPGAQTPVAEALARKEAGAAHASPSARGAGGSSAVQLGSGH